VGCLQVAAARKKRSSAVIVTILCDSGDKYRERRFLDRA
jgi:cysteine synthase